MDAPLNQRRQQPRRLCALCTYNERETLPALVDAVLATVPDTHLLVVDDNSPDGTGAWCHEVAQHEPRVSCLRRSAKLGLGTAVIAAIGHAIDHGFTYLATLDADGSHDPAALPQLFAVAENVDVVIGSRYCSGGHIEGWPWWRRIVSRGVNVASRRFLRLPVNDASGNFRVYRVEALKQLDLDGFGAAGYAWLEEILWHLDRRGASFAEVPITFRQRRAGRSKASWREAIGKIATIARLAMR